MALTIKNLNAGVLGTATNPAGTILAGDVTKSTLVKNIILTNKNTGSARTVTIWAGIKNGAGSPPALVEYPLSPIDVSIPAKGQFILDLEITLQATNAYADIVTGAVNTGTDVTYVINGLVRDL